MSLLDLPAPGREAALETAPASLRLQVRIRCRRLDRLLADGENPATDPRLALRAAQLTRLGLRAGLAAALRGAVRSLDETALTLRRRPQPPVDAASVRSCAAEIGDLARALTDIEPGVQGVAIVRGLLGDGLGPLYTGGQADRLHETLLTARAAL